MPISRLLTAWATKLMKNSTLPSTKQMTKIILLGSLIVDLLLCALLVFSFVAMGHHYVIMRIWLGFAILIYLLIVMLFVHDKRPKLGAWLIVGLYTAIGIYILHTWGINNPMGILILGFVIFLSSITLGPKEVLIVTAFIISLLVLLQCFTLLDMPQFTQLLLMDDSSYGDVAGYAIVFLLFAVTAWTAGRKMQTTLQRALKAESDVQKEKDAISLRLQAQSKKILEVQQKELKQLYKFAELGQLTTIILHDLANHLSVLTLDIEDINDRHQNSIAVNHAKESIVYIDAIIEQVRQQIRTSENTKKFSVNVVAKQTVEQIMNKHDNLAILVTVDKTTSRHHIIFGDPLRLSQAITILITNAIQATKNRSPDISLSIRGKTSKVLISVKDYGPGISDPIRRTLFRPQKIVNGKGLGIGLYVTKQIIETHFKGRIWLSPSKDYTEFTIEIPTVKRPA